MVLNVGFESPGLKHAPGCCQTSRTYAAEAVAYRFFIAVRAWRLSGQCCGLGRPIPGSNAVCLLMGRQTGQELASSLPCAVHLTAPRHLLISAVLMLDYGRSVLWEVLMVTELILIGWSVVLLFVHIAVQGVTGDAERGLRYSAGPRDGILPPVGPVAGRAERALRNYGETWPAFVGLALALAVAGRTGELGETGAVLWLTARLAYLPLYLLGVRWLRSLAWGFSALGLFLMLIRLF